MKPLFYCLGWKFGAKFTDCNSEKSLWKLLPHSHSHSVLAPWQSEFLYLYGFPVCSGEIVGYATMRVISTLLFRKEGKVERKKPCRKVFSAKTLRLAAFFDCLLATFSPLCAKNSTTNIFTMKLAFTPSFIASKRAKRRLDKIMLCRCLSPRMRYDQLA